MASFQNRLRKFFAGLKKAEDPRALVSEAEKLRIDACIAHVLLHFRS